MSHMDVKESHMAHTVHSAGDAGSLLLIAPYYCDLFGCWDCMLQSVPDRLSQDNGCILAVCGTGQLIDGLDIRELAVDLIQSRSKEWVHRRNRFI